MEGFEYFIDFYTFWLTTCESKENCVCPKAVFKYCDLRPTSSVYAWNRLTALLYNILTDSGALIPRLR